MFKEHVVPFLGFLAVGTLMLVLWFEVLKIFVGVLTL